jgi:hypothetical protein
MRPVLAAAIAAAAVAAIATLGGRAPRVTLTPLRPVSATPAPVSLCPPGSLPDDGVCIPVPPPRRGATRVRPAESIPRRPDRDPEYARYVLPVERALSIAELGERASADGGALPSGIAIQTEPGARVTVPTLEGQEGPAQVVYVGPFWGPTVVTAHTVRAGGATERYLVVVGKLGTARALSSGDQVSAGAQLGTAGSSLLVLATRLVRPGIELRDLGAGSLLSDANSVPVDPRNVLARGP